MFRPLVALAFFGTVLALRAETPGVAPSSKTFAPMEDLGETVKLPRNAFATVPGKNPDGWSIVVEPYVWALGLSGDVGVAGLPAVHLDISPQKILQHFQWGFFGRGELRKGRWGILADGFYAELGASGTPPGPLDTSGNLEINQGLASLALAYRVWDDRRWFLDVYAGARYNYLGVNVSGSLDTNGIQELSTTAVTRVADGLSQRVDSFLSSNAGALQATVENAIGQVSNGVNEELSGLSAKVESSLTPAQQRKLNSLLGSASGAYRELIAATVQARIATAAGQLTEAIQNRLTQAKQKLSQAVARELEDALPTEVDGSDWWVDPIVGVRGQINFTRWLFLAFQGDVGGFGAGSQIAWNVQGSLGINFTRHIFGEVGFRYYYLDYQGDYVSYQAAEAGFFTGVGVRY